MADFLKDVPKTLAANLEYRVKLRTAAQKDAGLRRAVKLACAHDILYFFNAWCFLHETRVRFDANGNKLPHKIPFITRPHQDEYFRTIEKNLGIRNIGIKKCRDEGFSWGGVLLALRDLACGRDVKVGLVSSTEKKSDDHGNMDSLGAKIDWSIRQLPDWFMGKEGVDWERNLNKHSWVHFVNGTSINAFSASPDTGRGGRYLWFLLDEFASREWQESAKDRAVLEALFGATDSKLIISTPEGRFGEFHRIMTEPAGGELVRIEMNWRDNPVKAKGEYRFVDGKPVAVDPIKNPLAPEYNPPTEEVKERWERLKIKGFQLDNGATRSPWYDKTCDQPEATLESVAKNVDAEWGGSVAYIFDDHFHEKVANSVQQPLVRGNFNVIDDDTWDFGKDNSGNFRLWCQLDAQHNPPRSQYMVCADFAHGRSGPSSANSALVIVDLITHEQVGEFASNSIDVVDFTRICLCVCKWFYGAYFAWEHNQPGNVCTEIVVDRGYPNYYLRSTVDTNTRKVTKHPGFWTDDKSKERAFAKLLHSVKEGNLVIRSKSMAEEFHQYIRDEKGKIVHAASGPSHGDRVIAIMVGAEAMDDRPIPKQAAQEGWGDGPPPIGTLAYREWLFEKSQTIQDDWDDRSTYDLRRPSTRTYVA